MSLVNSTLELIGRTSSLFDSDITELSYKLNSLVKGARFLVIGGAGSIGQAVTREIFKRDPAALHVVDVSELDTDRETFEHLQLTVGGVILR
jgi:FlaA1/EpsC-like NDP-sugar epimerase